MSQGIVVPRGLFPRKARACKLDDVTGVEYRGLAPARKSEVHVTTPMLVAVLGGAKVLHTASGDVRVDAGQAFFAAPGTYLYSEVLSAAGAFESLLFFMGDRFLRQFLEGRDPAPVQSTPREGLLVFPLTPLLETAVLSTLGCLGLSSAHREDLLRLKLTEILLYLSDADPGGGFLDSLAALCRGGVRDLGRFMREHYAKPLNLDEFAALSGRSLSTFKREFRDRFGERPKAWINRRRLEKARLMLSAGGQSVTEVCLECGFENPSHFARIFRQAFGLAPSKIDRN